MVGSNPSWTTKKHVIILVGHYVYSEEAVQIRSGAFWFESKYHDNITIVLYLIKKTKKNYEETLVGFI